VRTVFDLCLKASSFCAGDLLSGDAVGFSSTASRIGIVFSVHKPESSLVVQSKRKVESSDVIC